MTMNQASHLRVQWKQRADPRPCKHLNLELEHGNDDYLTDNYHCTACGELVAANTRALSSSLTPDQSIIPMYSGTAPTGS